MQTDPSNIAVAALTVMLCTGTSWAHLCFLVCTGLQRTLHLFLHFKPRGLVDDMFGPSLIPNGPFAMLFL